MSAVKVGISIPEIVHKVAKEKAKLLFGNNISSYISNLISLDNLEEIKKELKKEKSTT